jgi:hypothetical protein
VKIYRVIAFAWFMAVSVSGCGGSAPPEVPLPLPLAPAAASSGWSIVSKSTTWGTRDAGATVVHDGRIWMLGGWTLDNGSPRVLTDVWSSRNGIDWERGTTPDEHGMYPMAASINGQLFYLGGLKNSRQPDEHISNSIWSSSDGAQWSLRVPEAPWEARIGATGLQFNGEFWMLGGKTANNADVAQRRSDVWRSADGLAWTRVTAAASWSPRAFHCSVAHRGRLWVLGGGDWDAQISLADVWSSADGASWQRHPDPPWQGRIWHTCLSYAGRQWLVGGRLLNPSTTVEEIWSTVDGSLWAQEFPTIRPGARHAAFSAVFADRIWLIAGGADFGYLPPDVWQYVAP